MSRKAHKTRKAEKFLTQHAGPGSSIGWPTLAFLVWLAGSAASTTACSVVVAGRIEDKPTQDATVSSDASDGQVDATVEPLELSTWKNEAEDNEPGDMVSAELFSVKLSGAVAPVSVLLAPTSTILPVE